MGTTGAPGFTAAHRLLTKAHLRVVLVRQSSGSLKLGTRQNQQAAKVVLVEFLDRIDQIAVDRHQATERGANSRVTVRWSVSVHP